MPSCTRIAFVWVLFLLFFSLSATAADPMLDLDELIEQALAANPEITAVRQDAAAAGQRIPQAGALDDPMIGLGLLNVPENFDLDAEAMTMKEISLSQAVPFPGKRQLMREAARMEADAAEARIEEIANRVVMNIKLTYYDLSHIHRSIAVTRRNQEILEDFSKLARTRYSVGKGIQEDVIRVQVEISQMLNELLMLDQNRSALEARMNSLLNRPTAAPVGVPAEVEVAPCPLNIDQLQETAFAANPELRAMQSEVSAGQREFSLANRERYPDFNFRVSYGQRPDRDDMVSAMMELNLPVYAGSKQNRRIEQTAAVLSGREARFATVKNDLFYRIADLGYMARQIEKRIALYRTGIIPQTTLQIQSAMSAYTVNKADFMTLLDSRMRLYRFELDYHQALTEYAKTIASLEAAIGAPLEICKEPK